MYKTALTRILLVACLALVALAPATAQDTVTITNAASFKVVPLSPGSWGTAFADFGSVGVSETVNTVVPLPTILGGVEVLINGSAVPLNYVGPGQINFVVPFTTPVSIFGTPTTFVVRVSGIETYSGTINIVEAGPAFFTVGGEMAAALNQDSTVNSADNPAAPGTIVQFFATGPGPVSIVPGLGETAPSTAPLSETTGVVEAFVQATEASIAFSGLAPGFVALWQLNLTIPASVPVTEGGTVAVFVKVNGLGSEPVAIWVAQ
jgi:uncharacterized protein (TIGR03437 family)